MATPQLSPGVLVREVDLTVGRADNVLDNIGAIAGPFPIGPVNDPIDITTEQDLINVFGKPISTDAQYEYWMSAASYLSYGGVLKVTRAAGSTLANSNAGAGSANATMTGAARIDNYDDYTNNHQDTDNSFVYAAKNSGTWADGLKVCFIDDLADQTVTLSAIPTGTAVGQGVSVSVPNNTVIPGTGSTSAFSGYIKGIVTGIDAGTKKVDVKITSRVDTDGNETAIDYAEGTKYASLTTGAGFNTLTVISSAGAIVGTTATIEASVDWYNQQTLGLTNSTIYWKQIAPKPSTNVYVSDRQGKGDGLHVVVVDDKGTISGIKGNILEKHVGISKAKDAVSSVNAPQKIWYNQFLADYSANIYAGKNPSSAADAYWGSTPTATGFSSGWTKVTDAAGLWGQDAQGVKFSSLGNVVYTFSGGADYNATGGMKAELADQITAYNKFSNKDEVAVDFLIMGPGCDTQAESQAKANSLISIANLRKDCVATVGPHRGDIVGLTNTDTQTDNLIEYFSPLASSSYAVFDSGYKYTYDRFNNKFRYIPTNADVAGLMCRTGINAYPWFSPAGQQRGIINNAIKLAYNPSKAQRDQLYPMRINSVITQPGIGTLLFGDKTGLGYASAFDRINVRRLFLTVEQALQKAAEAQLFELNDELTRANFKNIVEPYLRDIQAKRGLYGFLVICDTTNNTPDVIDNNEFRADIFLKPAKSINYVTLTFVATRTGVSFEEVAGRV